MLPHEHPKERCLQESDLRALAHHYFTSALSVVCAVRPFDAAAIANVHFVAKLMLVFATYVPLPLSRALAVGPDIDIVGMFDPTVTLAPRTGLPAVSFTVMRIVSMPCFGGLGWKAAATVSADFDAASVGVAIDATANEAIANETMFFIGSF